MSFNSINVILLLICYTTVYICKHPNNETCRSLYNNFVLDKHAYNMRAIHVIRCTKYTAREIFIHVIHF